MYYRINNSKKPKGFCFFCFKFCLLTFFHYSETLQATFSFSICTGCLKGCPSVNFLYTHMYCAYYQPAVWKYQVFIFHQLKGAQVWDFRSLRFSLFLHHKAFLGRWLCGLNINLLFKFLGEPGLIYTVKRVDEVVRHPHLVTQDQNTQVSNKVFDIPEENFTLNIELFRHFSQLSN